MPNFEEKNHTRFLLQVHVHVHCVKVGICSEFHVFLPLHFLPWWHSTGKVERAYFVSLVPISKDFKTAKGSMGTGVNLGGNVLKNRAIDTSTYCLGDSL